MIDITAKIHDKFSIEFKVGFVAGGSGRRSEFALNTWFFIPDSLDINPLTYSNKQFYRDIKSNIRLITPIFTLGEIASGSAIPLSNLEKSFREIAQDQSRAAANEYEYRIKMFSAIFKSAIRDETSRIMKAANDDALPQLCRAYIGDITAITESYRGLGHIIESPRFPVELRNFFSFGDEFISGMIERYGYELIDFLRKKDEKRYAETINELTIAMRRELAYKKTMGYIVADRSDPVRNRELMFRHGVLKKYIESDLFLQTRRHKDGFFVEQVYYSLAAGLSMVFATVVAFSVQRKFGNFTMPLFVALVVSYMLKDRIKDLIRYYFAHRLKHRYFDNKIAIGIKETEIGWSKEGVDFITDDRVLPEVMAIRSRTPLLEAENRNRNEKILLLRKLVRIDRRELENGSEYPIAGMNDVMRLNLGSFIQKMDNPEEPLKILDDAGGMEVIYAERAYYLNIVMQLHSEERTEYRRFRVVFNRLGISALEEMA